MGKDKDIDQEAQEEENLFLLGNDIVWPRELDQLLLQKDPKRKKNLKSISITCSTNDKDRHKLVFLNQESPVSGDKDPAVTHLAYYIDSQTTFSESENLLLFPSYKKYTNYTDINGLSPFHMACATGEVKTVEQYLEGGEDVHHRFFSESNTDRRHKFTPLHFAVAHHNTEVVQLLLEHEADIDATDSSGITPLHLACAVSWDFKKSSSCEVLGHRTCRVADLDILELLLEKECDVNLKDHNGDTPILSIFKNDYYSPLRVNEMMSIDLHGIDRLATFLQVKQLAKFGMLITHGADITLRNYNKDSILHCIIEDLTSRRFAPTQKSDCDGAYAKIIDLLLELEVLDVDAKNRKGETPLALAVSLMSYDIVEILLKHNADPSSLRIDGHRFFRYPNVQLTRDLIKNLVKIASTLACNGYRFTLEDNLVIMKFLAHDVDNCDCGLESPDEMLSLSCQLIFFGFSAHMKRVVVKACENSNLMLKQSLLMTIGLYVEFCKYIPYAPNLDEETLEILNKEISTGLYESSIDKYRDDIKVMKSTKLSNGLSLYDIISRFPGIASVPRYLKYDDEEIDIVRSIEAPILGHLNKLSVRKYIGFSASESYIDLLLPCLPDICRLMILDFLDTEDILRLCAAALLE